MENDFREWLQVFGTLSAVLVALGIALWTYFRERRQRPSLELSFWPKPVGNSLDLVVLETPPSAWVRVRVTNKPRRRSAQDVEVLVTQFRHVDGDAGSPPLDTRPLKWSNAVDPEGHHLTRVTIPPGVTRHCDLLAIYEPTTSIDQALYGESEQKVRNRVDAGEFRAPADLQVFPTPSDRRHAIAEGTYHLELAVCARDVDAKFYRTVIGFDGIWRRGEEIWSGLSLDFFKSGASQASGD